MTEVRIPVFRPLLPTANHLLPYLERIDDTRWYTNSGPLVAEFEQRLAARYHLSADRLAVVANGTLALATSLATAPPGQGDTVPMPAWSFPATALSALWAGYKPWLLDVEPSSWALEPIQIPTELVRHSRAAMPVAPFGAQPNLDPWVEWSRDTGIPVIIDAAASFDSIPSVSLPDSPPIALVVSLHATKVFGIGEGGIVVSNDPDWIRRVRQHINFGFYGVRRSDIVGTNAKLSEYSAAVGLAALDLWPESRRLWMNVTNEFRVRLQGIGLHAQPGFGGNSAVPYCVVDLDAPERCESTIAELADAGIDSRRWWGLGQHKNPALQSLDRGNFNVTDSLASRTLGLPFWIDIGPGDVEHLFRVLAKTAR